MCLLLCLSSHTFGGVAVQDYCWASCLCSQDLSFWMWLLKATGLTLLNCGAVGYKEMGRCVLLCLTLPAPNSYKCELFTDDAATKGRLGPWETASAEQIHMIISVMAPLCLFPMTYHLLSLISFPLVFFHFSFIPSLSFLFFGLRQCSLGFFSVCVWTWADKNQTLNFSALE